MVIRTERKERGKGGEGRGGEGTGGKVGSRGGRDRRSSINFSILKTAGKLVNTDLNVIRSLFANISGYIMQL